MSGPITMKKSLFLTIALVFLFSSLSNAQTTTTLGWFHIGATPAQVAGFNLVVKVDNVIISGTPTCVAVGADTLCNLNVGTLANGNHTFVVSTLVDSVLRETQLAKTFPLTGGNAQPVNPRFTITVIITVS